MLCTTTPFITPLPFFDYADLYHSPDGDSMVSPFDDDDYVIARGKVDAFRENFKVLLGEGNYESAAKLVLLRWEEQEVEDSQNISIDKEVILVDMKSTEYFTKALDKLYPFMKGFFKEMVNLDKMTTLAHVIEEDDVDRLAFFLKEFEIPEEDYYDLLAIAISYLASECLEHVLSLRDHWVMTPILYYGWVTMNLGVPKADICAKRIAMHLLPKEVKDQLRPEDPTPYPMDSPKEMFEQLASEQSVNSFQNCMNFFLCTPTMKHWLENDLLEKKELDKIPTLLQVRFCDILLAKQPRNIQDGGRKLYFTWALKADPFANFETSYKFEQPYTYTDQLSDFTECLLSRHPHMEKRDKVRSLVASLALLDRPTEGMAKRGKELKGKRLILRMLELPWAEMMEDQEEDLVSGTLLDNWEERMPAKLVPVFKHDDFISGYSAEAWLDKCDVVGEHKGEKLSHLGEALLQLPSDSSYFLEALQEGGIIYQQRKQYWAWINERKSIYRDHYLASITHLKEYKTYELRPNR